MTRYFDLGRYSRPTSTESAEAQLWFDRGLIWAYAFNHEEAIECFERAIAEDPGFALAHWGVAYAVGPNYNKRWDAFDAPELAAVLEKGFGAVRAAKAHAAGATQIERDLIDAVSWRYQSPEPPDDVYAWEAAYIEAMEGVYEGHSEDLDVGALFADALMTLNAWNLWDLETGQPAEGAATLRAKEVLERALRASGGRAHPGVLHMYVHLMEMSPHPERALDAADELRELVPDAGHLRHMPTHIDILCGDYRRVVNCNSDAIAADEKYVEYAGGLNFYTLYRAHNFHFKIYGAMFLAQAQVALDAADELVASLPEDLLRIEVPPMADWLEAFVPMKMHVLIRFGRWQEIIAEPLPADPGLFCVTAAIMRYARGVALAAMGRVEEAQQEQDAFVAAVARVPESRYLFNNTCLDILGVAAEMLAGELEYRRERYDDAFKHLRRAVELDDELPYDEPWGWVQPTRHAYGALLLEQGQVEEAESVYAADLGLDDTLARACQHPNNVWSLHGYHECLVRLGKHDAARIVKRNLEVAADHADVPVESSCFCRLQALAEA